MKIAVVGASGFVGSAVASCLVDAEHQVEAVKAPRVAANEAVAGVEGQREAVRELAEMLSGADAVVNCSGNPDASASDERVLVAANAISPAVVARASAQAGVPRLIHVSSAVVQGRRPCLDESDETEEFSAYARSKAEGERLVRREFADAVVYRPPSVHAVSRRVTMMTAKIASSPAATVASPGTRHSPQSLIGNVGAAVAYLATCPQQPPAVVIHPWEGLTTSDVMELLGGKKPVLVPAVLAKATCRVLEAAGNRMPRLAANARRVEMLWFGQDQATSWLTTVGWAPPHGREAWRQLGEDVRRGQAG